MKDSQEFKDQCRERLKKIIGKKIETTMIHALSQFEGHFGHLFGHGLPDDRLTDEQAIMKQKWEQCRSNILTNGNQQKRNAFSEINMHDVSWQRYQTVLIPAENIKEL